MTRTHTFPVELIGTRTIVAACGAMFRRYELDRVSSPDPTCLTCHAYVHQDDGVTAEEAFGTPGTMTMFDHYQQKG